MACLGLYQPLRTMQGKFHFESYGTSSSVQALPWIDTCSAHPASLWSVVRMFISQACRLVRLLAQLRDLGGKQGAAGRQLQTLLAMHIAGHQHQQHPGIECSTTCNPMC